MAPERDYRNQGLFVALALTGLCIIIFSIKLLSREHSAYGASSPAATKMAEHSNEAELKHEPQSQPYTQQETDAFPVIEEARGMMTTFAGVKVLIHHLTLISSLETSSHQWMKIANEGGSAFFSLALQALDEHTPANIKSLVFQSAMTEPDAAMLQSVVDRYDTLAENSNLRTFFREFVQQMHQSEMIESVTALGSTILEKQYSEDDLGWAAITALITNGSAPAVDAILKLADRATDDTQENLFLAMHQIHSPEALPVLAGVALAEGRESSLALRKAVVSVLGQYQDLYAHQTLQTLVNKDESPLSELARHTLFKSPDSLRK
jgi:hypothetical protein